MTCPGGCIGGAGQPLNAINKMAEIRAKRSKALYQNDQENNLRNSYNNPEIKEAYQTYIQKGKVKLHQKNHKMIKS